MVLPFVARGRALQERLMTDRCRVQRDTGADVVVVADDIPCRIHKDRLYSEPGDPQDANFRSTQEWGFTLPVGVDVAIADYMECPDKGVSVIVGEVLHKYTWQMATRVWGTEPKVSTPTAIVPFSRYDPVLDDWDVLGDLAVQVVYDRNQPSSTPVRFVPGGRAVYKGGAFIVAKDAAFMPRQGDRFTLDGLGGHVEYVLPEQPQHVEVRFQIDISGERMG